MSSQRTSRTSNVYGLYLAAACGVIFGASACGKPAV